MPHVGVRHHGRKLYFECQHLAVKTLQDEVDFLFSPARAEMERRSFGRLTGRPHGQRGERLEELTKELDRLYETFKKFLGIEPILDELLKPYFLINTGAVAFFNSSYKKC